MISMFFANEDTKTTTKISLVCVVVNIIGNLILISRIAEIGITITTALTAWLNITMLLICAYKKGIFAFDDIFKAKIKKIILSCATMFLFLEAACSLFDGYLYKHDFSSIIVLVIILSASMLLYFCALFLLKAYSLKELKSLV